MIIKWNETEVKFESKSNSFSLTWRELKDMEQFITLAKQLSADCKTGQVEIEEKKGGEE